MTEAGPVWSALACVGLADEDDADDNHDDKVDADDDDDDGPGLDSFLQPGENNHSFYPLRLLQTLRT